MAGSLSSVGLKLSALTPGRHQRALFLGMVVLVTLIAADSPVADESLLDSREQPMGLQEDASSGLTPSYLSNTHQSNHEAGTADVPFHWGHVPSKNPFRSSQLSAEELQPLSTPSLIPSEHAFGYSPQFGPVAKPSTDWRPTRIDSAKQSSSHLPTPTRTQLQTPSNVSLTPLSPTTSQLSPNSEQKSLVALSEAEDGTSEKTPPIMTSQLGQPLEPPSLALADFPADESYNEFFDANQLSPSGAPLQENKPAHGTSTLPKLNVFLAPSYNVPFITPHHTSPSSEPTDVSPEDFYPTNTLDFDLGSGDYLETMSFLNADGEDYSMVTKVPSDAYDAEDYTETYDTSFPSRVGIHPSSLNPLHVSPSPSLVMAYNTVESSHPSSPSFTSHYTLVPTPAANSDAPDASDIDWPDSFTIQPTDVLLPDMNSLEYYTIQMTKENNGSDSGAEHRGNVTVVPISTAPNGSFSNDTNPSEEELSSDPSGSGSQNEFTTEASPQLVNASEPFLDPSIVPSHFYDLSSSLWGVTVSSTDWAAPTLTVSLDSTTSTEANFSIVTSVLPDHVLTSSSLTDVHWFVTDELLQPPISTSPVLMSTAAFSSGSIEPGANTTAVATDSTPKHSSFTTEQTHDISVEPTENVTGTPPVILGDQGIKEDDNPATMTLIPSSSEPNTAAPTTTTATTTSHQDATKITATPKDLTNVSVVSTTSGTATTTSRQYLCDVNNPEYLVKIGFPSGATIGYAKSQIRDILKVEFNKSVELQVVDPPPRFLFRVVSGPVVYTAISVVNSLRRSGRRFLAVSPNWSTPDNKYQVHTVLQFVPSHIDVRLCNFTESIRRGLTMAFAEVRRRTKGSTNFTVHIINVTMAAPQYHEQRLLRQPVDITLTVRGSRGYLMGSEISNTLMKLTMVEFSYYMGFPVLQIAEPFHYPELNTSQLLRSSWVRTVLLGVLDQKVGERTFQANMERRVAMLLGETMGQVRRVKRATTAGNYSVQIVSASRLEGEDHPLEIVYFVEGPNSQRVPAVQMANLLNNMDVQRAAIILGYRVQGVLAQPVEKVMSPPSGAENTNMWVVIGVVIPLLVVITIISILYWKLCRTDKLEFQPDAMTSIQQQRQKSSKSFRESRTSLQQTLPPAEQDVEFSGEEDEEWEYEEEEEECEEEEEEEEEEEKEIKRGKRPVVLPKTKESMMIEEEEEEEEDEEEEESEEEEEEEEDQEEDDEDKDEQKEKLKKTGIKPEASKRQGSRSMLVKAEGIRKEEKEKALSRGRRAKEELQAPSVKGFDFAKLHLGQHNKDDVMVIQESVPPGPDPGSLPLSIKDGLSPSENGEIPTPVSKNSVYSTKASRNSRRRERISPSEGDSVVSDHSSERESIEENLRAQATPSDGKQTRKVPINVLNGPPPTNGTSEQLSTAAIFDHVDRMSRATDASKRLPNKVQLIAMQPIPVAPLHSPPVNGKLSDPNQINKEIQVALRHKSEIEHHRNKIRLRAKRKGHYDFPTMDDVSSGVVDMKDQDRIYQKAQMQIDKILDPDTQMPSIFMDSKKNGRGRRSPKMRMKEQLNGCMMDADKDHLITEDSDVVYRKCPGVNNVAYVSDPDQGPVSPQGSPSPTDDVFMGPASSPPGHAPPPPPYMPPQPSIEEARQQMHSLLDDAFALVSPTSQGSTAGITLPGANCNLPGSSPPGRGPRHWGPTYQSLGPYPSRFTDLALSPPSVQGLTPRQGLGSSYLPPGEAAGLSDHFQPDSLYSSRGLFAEELPSSARPRPVGGSTGAQLHHLTQVGLSSRTNGFPVRAAPGQNGGWSHYHDDNFSRAEAEKDAFLDCPDYSSSRMFQMPRSGMREPLPPPALLDPPVGSSYLSAPMAPPATSPPTHSSASLIKAIREELMRLSQKQAAMPGYHS